VVTGDSQQLPPNDLYQVRWDDPEDESFENGVDSLLDLCARHLPQVQLSEHYRSRNPELIGFSNEHFYKNTLRLVPYEFVHRERNSAIQFVQVGGIWENHSNKIEAQRVVEISLELLREYPEKELGIVTFNFRQQNLILDLLEEASIAQRIKIPESLIVKNIENIQGDEKDIIIFSIGYAADLKGKLIMNFGTLNSDGGQNRLNVAITRAKEQVIVVASILPQQLAVEDAKHNGPRLLKKYLTYAMEKTKSRSLEINQPKNEGHWLSGTLRKYFEGQSPANRVIGLEFADLAIRKGNETTLLLTDDNRYFTSLSSKDLHGYFLQRLKEKSWNYTQLFTRNFWKNFEEEVKGLENKSTN
jgi:superfamily I DNA and/or RNA helicase